MLPPTAIGQGGRFSLRHPAVRLEMPEVISRWRSPGTKRIWLFRTCGPRGSSWSIRMVFIRAFLINREWRPGRPRFAGLNGFSSPVFRPAGAICSCLARRPDAATDHRLTYFASKTNRRVSFADCYPPTPVPPVSLSHSFPHAEGENTPVEGRGS